MSGTKRIEEKGVPNVRISVVTRSQSRQETPVEETSSILSEECGQQVELDPVLEDSLEIPLGDSTFEDESGSQIDELEVLRREIAEMAEARGPSITPPRFKGSMEENVEEYLQAFERIAKANGWNAEKKLVILPCYLDGASLKWYENLEQAEGDNLTWAIVKERMKVAFQSIAWEEQMEYKLRMRMQGEEEQVEAYIQDVLNLCAKLDADMSERCKIKHVLRGLKPSLLEKVMIMNNDTLESLLSNIRKVQTARFMAGQRVDQLMTTPLTLPVVRSRQTAEVIQPASHGSLESKIENLTSEFSKFSMRLMEESKRKEEANSYAHFRGRGWTGGPRGRGQPQGRMFTGRGSYRGSSDRGRTADGRIICYKCNKVGHFAINCRSNQNGGSGNEEGGH